MNIHESLLKDGSRNEAFFQALKQVVNSESFVLDIGSGTGLWAIVAAKLGAKHVVAIEQEELLIGLIRTLAHENGVADRVQVVNARSNQLNVDTRFDVVISETIGHLVFDEDIVQIMIDARERFLKPGGVLIPQEVALVVAPAHLESNPKLPDRISAEFDYFESLILNVPVGLVDKQRLKIVGPTRDLVRVDLNTVTKSPNLTELGASWANADTDDVNSFAVWAEVELAPEVNIATTQTSSWSTTVYRIKPFTNKQGSLEFKLTLTEKTNYWSTTLANGQHQETQSYSPALAATELLAQSRMNAAVFNQLKSFGLFEPAAKSAIT